METIISVALMAVGLIGVIVCKKKEKTNPNAQTLAFVFLACALVGAGLMLYGQFRDESKDIIAREAAFAEARSTVLGEFVGKKWSGKKAVIIANPQYEQSPISKADVDAMEAALKKGGLDATVEVLQVPQSDDPMAMETAINSKLYNGIFDKYKDAAVFVMMAQLPMDARELSKMKCWRFDGKKNCVVMSNTDFPGLNLKVLIKKGTVAAAVGAKILSEADYEKSVPSDTKAAFDARYVLVSAANLEQVAKEHSGFFSR